MESTTTPTGISWPPATDWQSWLKKKPHQSVPRTFAQNLRFRTRLIDEAAGNEEFQRDLLHVCESDPLFWINAFVWTYNPKEYPDDPLRPFISWEFQDEALSKLAAAYGRHDVHIEKARDMGATWMIVLHFLWRWLFRPHQSLLIVSRKDELVWKPGNQDALFSKLEWTLDRLPSWMRPRTRLVEKHLENRDNGSAIDGEATVKDIGRGGRRTAIMLDEFAAFPPGMSYATLAATADTTNCRIFNSTYDGATGAFYDQRDKVKHRLSLHWTVHPEKSKGLYYYDAQGTRVKADYLPLHVRSNTSVGHYNGHKLRSPWYDQECERRDKRQVAEQLDIDPHGAAYQFFDPELLLRLRGNIRAPHLTGRLEFDEDYRPTRFTQDAGGMLLWLEGDRPVTGRKYVAGADISMGTGATNSCLTVFDPLLGTKVAEFATPNMAPEVFALHVMAILRWFNGAFLAWEANGPGLPFGSKLSDMGYRNFYYRQQEKKLGKPRTSQMGWWNGRDEAKSLLAAYREALEQGWYVNRSVAAIDEMRAYIYAGDKVMHSAAAESEDPSGARDNHGDRVLADALSWLAARNQGHDPARKQPVEEDKAVAPYGSFAWRQKEYYDELRRMREGGSPERMPLQQRLLEELPF